MQGISLNIKKKALAERLKQKSGDLFLRFSCSLLIFIILRNNHADNWANLPH